MLKVRFKKKDESSKLPVKGSLNAACYDVYAHSIKVERPDKIIVGLGFMTEIPPGFKGTLVPRSSISKTNWFLANSMGIIDADYRGEWMMVLRTTGSVIYDALPFEIGERCGQIYFEKVGDIEMEEMDELSDTARGTGGFGSTGKN
jgi:dUTP pyrophosphatase